MLPPITGSVAMSRKAQKKPRPSGSDYARKKGQRGVVVYVSPAELERLKAAAQKAGCPLCDFVRSAALKAASSPEDAC